MVILIMGVAGVGKTTVASLLAEELGWIFIEADAFHPAENVAKMHGGTPLTDLDRAPWLAAIAEDLRGHQARAENVVLACSALKASYRQVLFEGIRDGAVVYLEAPEDVVAERLASRQGHFMNPALLASQYEALEPPAPSEHALTLDAAQPPDVLVAEIRRDLGI